jgi:hypothetical protein
MNAPEQMDGEQPAAGGLLAELAGAEPTAPGEAETIGGIPELSTGRTARRISLTNMVIALVLVVSTSSLYLMRKQGKGAGMTFQVTKIDYELDQAAKANAEQQRILAELVRTSAPRQIPADRIHKNPFIIEGHGTSPGVFDPELERQRMAEQERTERQRRQQEIKSRAGSLELNGVMGGPVPLARISGRTVRVGDTVADLFVVAAIHQRSVDLLADGEMFTLEMIESGQPQPRRPARPGR